MNPEKKLTHSAPAKTAAVFLLAIMAALTLACALEFIIANEFYYYAGAIDAPKNSEFYIMAIREGFSADAAVSLFNLTYSLRYWCVAIGALAVLCGIGCFVFLLYSAGHRGYTDEIFLNPFDKIPFDVTAAFWVLAFILCCSLIANAGYYGGYILSDVALVLLAALAAGLCALALIMTFATRVKYGGWWKNTVIYRVLRLLWRWAKAVWHWIARVCRGVSQGLPIVWRTAIIVLIALFLLDVLSFSVPFSSFLGVLVWFALNAAIFLAACYGAMQMKKLKLTAEKLAEGDFEYKLDTSKMYWEFKNHGDTLNSIGDGMARAVSQRMKSERLKTELITNVSHDIKTPLTSIINYVDLLQKPHTPEEEAEYLDVLSRQSQRLRKLTEDLVEASKASTGNMSVSIVPTNTAEIINQSLAEYAEKLKAGKLNVIVGMPDPPLSVMADGRLLWRVLDNLFNNVCKYAMPDTRVYVDVTGSGDSVRIEMKNISRSALNISADELMERFVRGDASRSTEGSGLGLNIAKSLTELQKGTFSVVADGDLFKAIIVLPAAK